VTDPAIKRTSVLVADDHPLVLRALNELIAGQPDFEVVATVADGTSALARAREILPNLAVLDLSMPGIGGLELLNIIMMESLPIRVIFLTASIPDDEIVYAIEAGVYGILLKESAPEALLSCMRQVALGKKWLPPDLVDPALERQTSRPRRPGSESDLLTIREADVVRLVCEGLSNKSIGRKLNLSEGTVKIHLHNVYRKLEVNNRTTLAKVALGWRR